MNKEYLTHLKQQFLKAVGSKCDGINYKEFEDYLLQINKLGNKYINYLSCLGLDINDSKIAEVNKGVIDSVAYKKSNISLITPYTDGMDSDNNEIYRFHFVGKDKTPCFKTKSGMIYHIRNITQKHTFITHNPYNYTMIEGFSDLSYAGYSTVFGMYGMIYDKDFSDKIKKFENIKSIINACKDEIIKDGEEYYLIARSNVKVKTKVR